MLIHTTLSLQKKIYKVTCIYTCLAAEILSMLYSFLLILGRVEAKIEDISFPFEAFLEDYMKDGKVNKEHVEEATKVFETCVKSFIVQSIPANWSLSGVCA